MRIRSNLVVLIFLFLEFGVSVNAQSSFGNYLYYGRDEGMHHSFVRYVYEDKKGFVWLCTSEGIMRWDGVSFEPFGRSNIDSTYISDNNTTCIVQDNNEYAFWIGTVIGGICKFSVEKNCYKNFPLNIDSTNQYSYTQITNIVQLGNNKFLVGTKTQGLYFFSPYSSEKYTKITYGDPNIRVFNQIRKGENYIWVATGRGILKLNNKGKFIYEFLFTNEKYVNVKGDYNWSISDVHEVDEDNILFSSGRYIFRYSLMHDKLELITKLPIGDKIKEFLLDSEKNIWISTSNTNLFFYKNENSELVNTKIKNDEIMHMTMLKKQKIALFGLKTGLCVYNYNYSKFHQSNIGGITNNETNTAYSIYKDSKKGIWIQSNNGNLFYKEDSLPESEKIDFGKWNHVYKFFEDTELNIWMFTYHGLYKYNLDNKVLEHIFLGNVNKDIHFGELISYGILSKRNFWLAGRNKLILYNPETDKIKGYNYPPDMEINGHKPVVAMFFDKDSSSLWFALRTDELVRFNIKNKVFSKVKISEIKGVGRKPGIILNANLDTLGRVWLATFGSGILIYDPVKNTLSDKMAKGILENNAYAIVEDNQHSFWITTNLGIANVNPYTEEIKVFNEKNGILCKEFNERSYYKLPDGSILFGGLNWITEFNPKDLSANEYNAPVYIKSWTIENKQSKFKNEFEEKINYLDGNSIHLENQKGQIKFYASVLNYSHSNYNKIKWKLEGFEDEWHIDFSKTPIVYPKLNCGRYTLILKGVNADGHESKSTKYITISVKAQYYETIAFKLLIALAFLSIIFFIFRLRIKYHLGKEEQLARMVEFKTKELLLANEELERSFEELEWTNEEIVNQKTELEIHRNNLEDIVRVRTRDLEVAKLKAEKSDNLKTAFLANLSHEIRTPMNAIMGFSNLLKSLEEPDSQKEILIDSIHSSSNTLLGLINDIIDISRIESGNLYVSINEINLFHLIKDVFNEICFEKKENGVVCRKYIEFNETNSVILTDHLRLKQIICNLLTNAIKFTEKGYVEFTSKIINAEELIQYGFEITENTWDKDIAMFIVKDTGIGISRDGQEFIFQPFTKIEGKEKHYEGMGLGLSIVKNLVDLLGGDIRLESEENEGCTFYFYVVSDPKPRS